LGRAGRGYSLLFYLLNRNQAPESAYALSIDHASC